MKITGKLTDMRASYSAFLLSFFLLLFSGSLVLQGQQSDFDELWKKMSGEEEQYTRHVVRKGETLFSLARKYGVTMEWIRNTNPFTQRRAIQVEDTLLFPGAEMQAEMEALKPKPKQSFNHRGRYDRKEGSLHVIEEKESLYSISRKYGVTVEELLATNPVLDRNTIRVTDTLIIPLLLKQKMADEAIADADNNPTIQANFTHIVSKGETLWSLAKSYGVDLNQLIASNEGIVGDAMSIGDTLAILPITEIEQIKRGVRSAPDHSFMASEIKEEAARRGIHLVSPGETLYGLSRQYDISLDEIRNWNHLNSDDIRIGDRLVVRDQIVPDLQSGIDEHPLVTGEPMPEQPEILTEEIAVNPAFVEEENPMVVKVFVEEPLVEEPVLVEEPIITLETAVTEAKEIAMVEEFRVDEEFVDPNVEDVGVLSKEELNMYRSDELIVEAGSGERTTVLPELPEIREREVMDKESKLLIHEVDYSKLKPIFHVLEPGEKLTDVSKQYNQVPAVLMSWNKLDSENIKELDKVIIGWYLPQKGSGLTSSAAPKAVSFRQEYINRNNNQIRYKLDRDRGTCTWLRDDSEFDNNFYVLHADAPRNAVVRITNPMNKKTVYAKIIGKLPKQLAGQGVVMNLSSAIVKKLGLRDDRFMLEWSYHRER
ncbi:LysM peptidoglycan-binding domain-containing protein [Chitinophagales bacterium]|nr:LysM peptidoglycan-binding domain-containing protein [Chitinophagales bacterium]